MLSAKRLFRDAEHQLFRILILGALLVLPLRPALAGPPYVSDDPEPTDYRHFEIYTFTTGTLARDGMSGEAGVDVNYGAAPDLQLTVTLPLGFDRQSGARTRYGASNVELAAKYRFLHQKDIGVDVSIFPRVFLPSGSNTVGDNRTSFLLPLWLEKDWESGWTVFGGGGCVLTDRGRKDFCLTGAVVTYQVRPDLRLGPEVFYQSANLQGTPASTSIGFGAVYDLNDTYHLLAYMRRGVQNTDATDQLSWYTAVLFTF